MKLTVANANITNALSTARITLSNASISNFVSIGSVSIAPSQISVGNTSITPTVVSVPALVLGGSQFAGGLQGGIINYQEFTANGTWNNPYYIPTGIYSQGLTYTFYTQGTETNPTNEAGLAALFNIATSSPTVTFGGSGVHSTNINWADVASTGAGGATGTKPSYLPVDKFSWMVEGYILAPETGTYFFGCDGDDAMDVFVNGVNVANFYGGHGFQGAWTGGVNQVSSSISLTAGQYYTFRARMQEGGGGDGIQVGWRKPSDGAIALIPASAFYYQNFTTNTSLTGYEQVLVMAWGGGGGGASNNSISSGGGGGSFNLGYYKVSDLSNTISVVIGNGGTASRTTTTSLVSAGNGGNSSFGSFTVYGGTGAGSDQIGGGGGGVLSQTTALGGAGGAPLGGAAGNPGGTSTFGGGGGGNGGANGGVSIFGGGGGSRGNAITGGNSIYGGGGGGTTVTAVGGTSVFGGAGANSTGTAFAPGGGGGSSVSAASAGARGEVRVWVFGAAGTTAGAPTYTLTANTTSIYGGDAILYTVSTTNVANGTILYYTLNNSSTAVSSDFSSSVNGSIIISGGTGTFTLTANTKTFASNTGMTFDVRTLSTTGTIVVSNNSALIRKTPTLTFLSHNFQDGLTAYTDITITGASLGTAAADRKIVVSVLGYNCTEPITCTIAGVAATQIHSIVNYSANPWWDHYVFIADVPTGTTGNIVLTDVVGQYGSYSAAVYALYDAGSSTPISTASSQTGSGSSLGNALTNLRNSSVILTTTGQYRSNEANPMTVSINSANSVLTTNYDDVRIDLAYFFMVEGSITTNNFVSSATVTSTFTNPTSAAISSSVAFR